jgi:polyvinyl alcohol dehydrogenase (cytochrome)
MSISTRPSVALGFLLGAAAVLAACFVGEVPVHAQSAPGLDSGVASARTERGFGIFQTQCLNCHGKPEYKEAPSPAALREMSPEHIYDVLTHGVMFPIVGAALSDPDRKVVAEMISGRLMGAGIGSAAAMPNRCPADPPMTYPARSSAWNGFGRNIRNTRYQPDPGKRLNAGSIGQLKLKWAFGLPGSSSAYSQPTVVSGWVFIGADTGTIYALDARSGCVHWSYQARSGVRNALTVGLVKTKAGTRHAVFFGDLKSNVYGLDAQTGRALWVSHVEENITDRVTASPQLYKGVLYTPISSWEEFAARAISFSCCTSVGKVVAVNAATGKMLWGAYVIPTRPRPTRKNSAGVQQYGPAGGSVWNTPAVDPKRHAIYFGTGDATTSPTPKTTDAVMAMDMATGKILWSYQAHRDDTYLVGCQAKQTAPTNCPQVEGPDWDIPVSLILTQAGKRRLILAATKPGDVLALDPDKNGALVWRMNVSGPLAATPAPETGPVRYSGMMWGGATDGANVYYGLTGGGMAAVRVADGKLVWRTPLNATAEKPVSDASPATGIPGAVIIGGSDGAVFALSSANGDVLWRYNTARPFDTVNHVPANGATISSAGATVAGDMVFLGSGYSVTQGNPGNVLLAFGLD